MKNYPKFAESPIRLAEDTINREDINALTDWLNQDPTPRLTKGEMTLRYEARFAETMGSKHAVFVNSGSSAILLSLYSLIVAKQLKNKKICVPALSWATDLAPVIQFGLTPLIVDCNLIDLSVDLTDLERVFQRESPSALILVSVLGLVPYMDEIVNLCDKYRVLLIEDVCESTGSEYENKKLGTFGLLSCHSTYYGHITTSIEGGFICTDSDYLKDILLMIRSHGWSRELEQDKIKELQKKHNVSDFDNLYTFYQPAFNLRSTDLQAFIGLRQLDRFEQVVKKRFENYKIYRKNINHNWRPPAPSDGMVISNLGYPVICEQRDAIIKKLQENNVEVRPLIAGSMGKQPIYTDLYPRLELPHVTRVDKCGMYLPNHANLSKEQIEWICSLVNSEQDVELHLGARGNVLAKY